jgi:hypothetical protein
MDDVDRTALGEALTRLTRVDRSVLQQDELLIAREGRVSVFYAPFDAVNLNARVVLLGLTPGWQQMRLAIDAYRTARELGRDDAEAQQEAKQTASFAGMRERIVRWLDHLGVNEALGLKTTAELFQDADALHPTSLIRYPVFIGEAMANYRGTSPRPEESPLLRAIISSRLVPELVSVADALVVPMGTAVARALLALEVPVEGRCLIGFPHPSGANAWANRQIAANEETLRAAVLAWRRSTIAP